MTQVCKIEACAKINIGLRIGRPRSDGYHPLVSLFHAVGLCDSLVFERQGRGKEILVQGDFDCPGEKTTVFKAIELFRNATGNLEEVKARVDKGIPAMAGLGGGSADAAAALVAMDRLFGTGLGLDELASLGAGIGSDVPFFLYGGAAIVSGRGDIINPIAPRTDLGILLLYPGFGVSTKWAYSKLDEWRDRNDASPLEELPPALSGREREEMVTAFGKPPQTWDFRNSFEEPLASAFPLYREIRACFADCGASFVSVTGSGSCMYGVYASFEEALSAKESLRLALSAAHAEKTLSGMALHAIKPLETSLLLG